MSEQITGADVDAALERMRSDAKLPKERRAWELLDRQPDGTRKVVRHYRRRDRVVANYNRDVRSQGKTCRACGVHFIPKRVDGKCCPDCVQKQKAARGTA